MEERKEWLKDWIFRLSVVAVTATLAIIAIIFSGCGQGATNITGPSPITTGTTVVDFNDPDIQLVKQYNNNPTVRWNKSIITVYDSTGMANQSILDEWNNYLNGARLVFTNSAPADIEIIKDDNSCGGNTNTSWSGNYIIYKSIITIHQSNSFAGCDTIIKNGTVKHEIGHAIGFFGHIFDGGVMGEGSLQSTDFITISVRRTLVKLYSLQPGTKVG
ncbi:hypothetical protein HZB04_04080 [Candidatus Wolfebacteria bacterium]|nr:hypothetical protein [Candidatus Wolfebacteria bacterium]